MTWEEFLQIGKDLGANPKLLDLSEIDLPLFNPRPHALVGLHDQVNA